MRRIALFLHDLAASGVVANALRLAAALAERGHAVHLLVVRGGAEPPLPPGVTLTVLGPGGGGRARELVRAVPALRRELRGLAPAILVSAGNHGHLVALAAARGLAGIERVLRISNAPVHPGDGPLLRGVRLAQLRLFARAADRLLLVSPRLARHPALARALAAGRAAVVPNGVPVGAIRARPAEPADHPWARDGRAYVVAVGRLVRQKNLATLVRAVARVPDGRLLVIGGGDPAALAAQAAALGIADRVAFTGELANPLPLVRAARVFALPSLWEGRSNALLEALAIGTPVVAARTAGDAAELLGEGAYGLLVDPHDAAALAAALVRQLGPDPIRPGERAAAFDLTDALARAVAFIVGPTDA